MASAQEQLPAYSSETTGVNPSTVGISIDDAPTPVYNTHASLDDPWRYVAIPLHAIRDVPPPTKKSFMDRLKPVSMAPQTNPVIMIKQSIYNKYFAYQGKGSQYKGTEPEFTGKSMLARGELQIVRIEKGNMQDSGLNKNPVTYMGADEGIKSLGASSEAKYRIFKP